MPNLFAYLMLVLWPVVAIVMFRKLPLERALIWCILGGYLVLPPVAEFNLPMLPALDKVTIPNLMALMMITLGLGYKLRLMPRAMTGRALLVLFLFSPFLTVLSNGEPLFYGPQMIPGLRPYDAISAVANQAILLVPFFLARQFLASAQGLRELLLALVIAGLIYSLPVMLEARLSPQLNVWVYGFFQHDFSQALRFGGYRPFVFLYHGLWVAFLMLTTVMAALALARHEGAQTRPRNLVIVLYLLVMLVLCRSLGPLVYAVAVLPLLAFAGPRFLLRLSYGLAAIVLLYPILRGTGVFPVDTLLDYAALIDADRAGSLAFRFHHEEALLERAAEKALFGWGGWGRGLIFDPFSGALTSVADGRWVIVIGQFGWIGYIVEFGLLSLPLMLLAFQAHRLADTAISPWLAPLALILAINMVDLLPNATLIPFTWLLAGALLGHAEALLVQGRNPAPSAERGRKAAAGKPRRPRTVL